MPPAKQMEIEMKTAVDELLGGFITQAREFLELIATDTKRLTDLCKSENRKTVDQGGPDPDIWYDWREDVAFRMGHLSGLKDVATTILGIDDQHRALLDAGDAICVADRILDGKED
jgi:hypothetical protein